jgi:hypothetical protein
MFWIAGVVLHATVLGIIAFFVLFAAGKAEGFVALLGRLLGYWVLLLAILSIVGGVYCSVTGKQVGPGWMHGPGHGWMHQWSPPGPDGAAPPPPPAAAPTTPAPATPAKP